MKTILRLCIIVLGITVSGSTMAFDSATDCATQISENKLKDWKLSSLQGVFNDYTNPKYSAEKDNQIILCFDGLFYDTIKSGLALSPTTDKSIFIYGLNITLKPDINLTTALLILSGSNITLQNSTLTGNGTGTAIQVNGTGMTIGPSVSLTNFATGIYIAKDASALATQDKFTNVATPIVQEAPGGEGVISVNWLGKHVSETDATKVDRIAGKLGLTECKGSVEMYLKKFLSS